MRTFGLLVTAAVLAVVPAAAQNVPLGPLAAAEALGPRTVIPALVACTDRPTSAAPDFALSVAAPHAADAHGASTKHHLVVLNAGTLSGLMVGQQYFTRRLLPPVNGEPMTIATPGSIRTTGWLTVVAADERTALARIDYACTAIEAGDYLDPYAPSALPVALAAPGRTNFDDLARIVFGVDRRESFGAGDFLSIDHGITRGVATGARVAFYRDRANGTPLVEIGSGVVVEVSADTSKVVVQRSSEELRRGDYAGFRTP